MKPIKLYTDLSIHLYEGEARKKRGTPTPITYLTQWKIVGNSEVHGNEIWSCGEYNATDGKWHILVQPQGGSIADIALDAPLRKVNDVADKIEFANGVATLTRNIKYIDLGSVVWNTRSTSSTVLNRYSTQSALSDYVSSQNLLLGICSHYTIITESKTYSNIKGIAIATSSNNLGKLFIYDDEANTLSDKEFGQYVSGVELIYELATPTTELVDAPQIEEAESYTCVISQGGKTVEWSSFETE